tara:strand:- start:711 stop:1142 length:432 start_codon:yes stop_codon:yes gene_type:complete
MKYIQQRMECLKANPLMEIEIIAVGSPKSRIYGMFTEIDPFKIIKDGKVRVVPKLVTKTRISTSLYVGNAMKGINMEVDGIKTYRDVRSNYFTSETEELHYFVKSKKQDYETYKKYVREVVKEAMSLLGIEMDKLIVELEVWN